MRSCESVQSREGVCAPKLRGSNELGNKLWHHRYIANLQLVGVLRDLRSNNNCQVAFRIRARAMNLRQEYAPR